MTYAQYQRLRVSVGASNRKVIKAAHRLLAKRARFTRAKRQQRHAWLRAILAEHCAARKLYRQVTSGRF